MRRIQSLNLVGGYKLKGPWARGSFAVDWRSMTLKMTAHVHGGNVLTYHLAGVAPTMDFPTVHPVEENWGWWPTQKAGAAGQYANGLWFDGSRWWAAVRAHYDTAPRGDMDVYADDGTVWPVPLPQQKFSGFVKPQPGADLISWPWFGCGGYESGQGTSSGPTKADYLGNVYLEYDFLGEPGPNLEHWDTRAPRLPDYSVRHDTWVGWAPREIGGTLQGRCASDWYFGGGIQLPDGPLVYFPYQGTGELRYTWSADGIAFDQRTITFAEHSGMNRTRLIAYDPATHECVEFDREMDFWTPCGGQEIDPQGRLWLSECFAHGDAEVQIRVYEVTYA